MKSWKVIDLLRKVQPQKNQNLSTPLRLSDFKWNMLPICPHPSIHSGAIFARTAALKARWRWRNDTIIGNYANPSQSATTCCCWSTFFERWITSSFESLTILRGKILWGKTAMEAEIAPSGLGSFFFFSAPPLGGWAEVIEITFQWFALNKWMEPFSKIAFARFHLNWPPPPSESERDRVIMTSFIAICVSCCIPGSLSFFLLYPPFQIEDK